MAAKFVIALSVLPAVIAQYGQTFTGDGTYYGETTGGHCAIRDPIPGMYSGMIPVALNGEQYGNSEMCGACIEGEGSGVGEGADPIQGPFKAYVSDSCFGCAGGDLDFAQYGDGRWDISWSFVPCPGGEPDYMWEGSNEWYWKIQPRGTSTPATDVSVSGVQGTRTADNFFEVHGGPFNGAQEVVTTTMDGETYTSSESL